MYTLLLRLSAPLQSWGSGSLFDTRETDYYPTKSGVVGMVAAAMGRKRGESLDDLARLKFGVRVDHQGVRITDFQITEMATDFITDMGGKYNSNLSHRSYLSDAVFLVGLESESNEMLRTVETALRHPIYALSLGRRSCPPSQPLVIGIREGELYDALLNEEWLLPEWRRKMRFQFSNEVRLRILVEDKYSKTVVRDKPVSFSPFKREYEYRGVTEKNPKVISNTEDIYITGHDPMSELR